MVELPKLVVHAIKAGGTVCQKGGNCRRKHHGAPHLCAAWTVCQHASAGQSVGDAP